MKFYRHPLFITGVMAFGSWMLWTTTNLYQLRQDVALIRQMVSFQIGLTVQAKPQIEN